MVLEPLAAIIEAIKRHKYKDTEEYIQEKIRDKKKIYYEANKEKKQQYYLKRKQLKADMEDFMNILLD